MIQFADLTIEYGGLKITIKSKEGRGSTHYELIWGRSRISTNMHELNISSVLKSDLHKIFNNPKGKVPRACPWVSTLLGIANAI